MTSMTVPSIKDYLHQLQETILAALQERDRKASLVRDEWDYTQGGGGGRSWVLSKGDFIEKAGVNFSAVNGISLPAAATASRPELRQAAFQAMGVSLVIHPDNPFIPTTHMNVRFLLAEPQDSPAIWWFGGGFDLTPYYGFVEDCVHWHRMAKAACDPFGEAIYPEFKRWCDDYFYLPHRGEARGIGGLFFDDLNRWDFATCQAFMQSVGDHFLLAYLPIFDARKDHPFAATHKAFQELRRGRYVEFNLLYDRGTLFGLQSGGRTESILMSLPPKVAWTYQFSPEPGSPEAQLYRDFLPARDWLKD